MRQQTLCGPHYVFLWQVTSTLGHFNSPLSSANGRALVIEGHCSGELCMRVYCAGVRPLWLLLNSFDCQIQHEIHVHLTAM